MAHRLVKKNVVKATVKEDEPVFNGVQHQPQQPIQTANNSQNRLPRPLLESVDKIYVHDKQAYQNRQRGFPAP